MQENKYRLLTYIFIWGSTFSLLATETLNKDKYTLMDPTPKELMRSLEPDRPGATDSAITLDAGHYRIESGLIGYTKDKSNEGPSFNEMYLNAGITNNLEIQIGIGNYVINNVENTDGFETFTMRMKWNLVGNDGGDYAIALLPSLYIPSGTRDVGTQKLEGGFSLPVSMSLPLDLSFSFMPQWDVRTNSKDRNYHVEFLTGFVLGHSIIEDLSGYIQFRSVASSEENANWSALSGGGLTYLVNQDFQLDLGIDIGLTNNSDDYKLFFGLVSRF